MDKYMESITEYARKMDELARPVFDIENDLCMFKNCTITDINHVNCGGGAHDLIITIGNPEQEESKIHILGNVFDDGETIYIEGNEPESAQYTLHEPTFEELEELKQMNVYTATDISDENENIIGHSVVYSHGVANEINEDLYFISLHLYNNGKLLISDKF